MQDCNRARSDSWGGEVLGIDKHTGLPKLAIELPPEDVEKENLTMKGVRARSEEGDNRQVRQNWRFELCACLSSYVHTSKVFCYLVESIKPDCVLVRLSLQLVSSVLFDRRVCEQCQPPAIYPILVETLAGPL